MSPVGDDVFPERVEMPKLTSAIRRARRSSARGASPWEGEAILRQKFLVITAPEAEASHDNHANSYQNLTESHSVSGRSQASAVQAKAQTLQKARRPKRDKYKTAT